jgi:hypothetical protein
MKKILIALSLFAVIGSANAHGHGYWRGGYWVGPAVIGGVVGYSLARQPYYYPPVVVQQQPVIVQQPAPTVYTPPVGYHWEQILDSNCQCYRTVLIPN